MMGKSSRNIIERISWAIISARTVWLALMLFIMPLPAAAAPATAVTVTVDGTTYEIEALNTSFDSSASLLQSQPWWGKPNLADSIINSYLSNGGSTTTDLFVSNLLFAESFFMGDGISNRMINDSDGPYQDYGPRSLALDYAIATSVSSPSSVPEINAGTLSQVCLILFALWLVVRRRESSTQAQ